ncbi:MAG: ABC transporter substrate-binding protein [Deltaproteobacteria bacterium]|nr:ABC transporter substrate-binding protein [Deltaproteobacteria bacterium]
MPLKLLLSFLLAICLNPRAIAQEVKKPMVIHQAISTPDFGYLPTLFGRAKGMFAQENIDLKLLVVSVRVALPALLAKEVHFATAGSALPASLRGSPVKAMFFSYKTSTFQLVVRPEITAAQNLKGKTISISTPGSSNDIASRLILKRLGLEPGRDVNLLRSGDSQARVLGMEPGTVAGSAVNPDVAAFLTGKGYRILMNSADVYPVPFSGMSVHDEVIRDNPDLIKRWLRAHIRAMLQIRKNPEEAAQVAAKELKMNADIAIGATKLLLPAISGEDPGGFTDKGMRLNMELSGSRLGMDTNKIPISQVADVALLREVQRELGIHCKDGYQCK